jgi:predicted nucleotidyltransferase
MQLTSFGDVNILLVSLLGEIRTILGEKLIGLYLFGSLVWGDFDHEISDIDLLAAISDDLNSAQHTELKSMHDNFALQHPHWDNRIEVQYLSRKGLKAFKTQKSKMSVISPGEPFHEVEAGKEWLMNWYFVQEYGLTLFGRAPESLIEPISDDEFIQAVKEHALSWRENSVNAKESRAYQSYAVLTLCRALYSINFHVQVSKRIAAEWAKGKLPEWAHLIENAMLWRADWRNTDTHPEASYPEVVEFVNFVTDQIN